MSYLKVYHLISKQTRYSITDFLFIFILVKEFLLYDFNLLKFDKICFCAL